MAAFRDWERVTGERFAEVRSIGHPTLVVNDAGALDRDKQIALVDKMTGLIATAASDPELKMRTWVLLTEAAPGGWGLWGHAQTNEELVSAARAEMGRLYR